MPKPSVVADIMTHDLITLREEDNLQEVLSGMEALHKRHVPVVDGKRLVGLVSHRDMLRLSAGRLDRSSLTDAIEAKHQADTFVAEVMTRDLDTTTPDTPIIDAAKQLAASTHGCLPVVNAAGELVGIITEHDFVVLAAQLLEG